MDFVEIIKKEREAIHSLLQEIAISIHALESKYKRKLGELLERTEKAIGYLEKTKIKKGSNA